MKRYAKTLLLAGLLTISGTIIVPAATFNPPKYETYYQGNTQYEFAYIQMGNGIYVDKNTLQSLVYTPPVYKLSATIYSRKTPDAPLKYPRTVIFEYHYDTHQVYFCNAKGIRNPTPIRTDYHASEADMRSMAAAKVMWRMAYGTNW